jgi:hypothetical protein
MNNTIKGMAGKGLLGPLSRNTASSVENDVRPYIESHLERFRRVLGSIPLATGHERLLEVGSMTNTVPVYFCTSVPGSPKLWLCRLQWTLPE